ncbi:MAG: Hsp20/alpha crystallin family protein, partial [Parcubacteria group bacterium]|nr:Hsp20/alpha crystallin family protein [Parcubacteria group bacterium]
MATNNNTPSSSDTGKVKQFKKVLKNRVDVLKTFFDEPFSVQVNDLFGTSDFPEVDVKENEKEFTVVANVPGFTQETVTVDVTDTSVTLKGTVEVNNETNNEQFHKKVERKSTSFARKIVLPSKVQRANVVA